MLFREVFEITKKMSEEIVTKTKDEYSFKIELEAYIENLISWFKNDAKNPRIFRLLKNNTPPWLREIYTMNVNENPWRIKRENTRSFKQNNERV